MSAAIIFCQQCRSALVDIRYWTGPRSCAVACSKCGNVAELWGFTIGRADVEQAQLDEAYTDAVFTPRLVGAEVKH